MPPRSSASRGGGGNTRRYAATVEKGENAWKREWSSFISGVDLKQVRDGTRGIALKASKDLEQQAYAQQQHKDDDGGGGGGASTTHGTSRGAGGGRYSDDEDEVAPTTYSYLFISPAQRKADREAKLKQQREEERQRRLQREREKKQKMKERRQRQRAAAAAGETLAEEEEDDDDDDDDDERSKHQKALLEAQKRGLKLEGMTRKEKRSFLHLTVTEEQQQAQQHAKEFKLHELMDERIAWYQQGPHPIDLIAEKLVRKKAEKKGKQMGLTRYNYLLPHPSWMAKRMQRRREAVMVGMGRHFVYDDEGQLWEPLRGVPVELTKVNFLLSQPLFKSDATTATTAEQQQQQQQEETASAGRGSGENEEDELDGETPVAAPAPTRAADGAETATATTATTTSSHKERKKGETGKRGATAATAAPTATAALERAKKKAAHRFEVLDPQKMQTSYVRRVLQDPHAALALQQANLSTKFLSSGLVHKPNIGLADEEEEGK